MNGKHPHLFFILWRAHKQNQSTRYSQDSSYSSWGFGFLIFSSASLGLLARDGASFGSVAGSQFLFGIVGGGLALFGLSSLHYRHLRKYAFYIFLVTVVLTLAVFIPGLGMTHGGATRWISIGGFTLQPAELLKIGS
jgi:cell division protein FtsW